MTGPMSPSGSGGLTVCAPLRFEARAVRRGLTDAAGGGGGGADFDVVATGMGARRSRAAAERLRASAAGAVAIAGTCGGLAPGLEPGDLIVATVVIGPDGRRVSCPAAPLLAGQLRRAGLRVHEGPVATVGGLHDAAGRSRALDRGAIAVDMESSYLIDGAAGRPAVVLRAVSDTPRRPLLRPGGMAGGVAALRSLRLAGPALAAWAAATSPREVLLAGPRSFCAGVERAIEIVERAAGRGRRPGLRTQADRA